MTVLDASAWLEFALGQANPDELPAADVLVPAHFDSEVMSALRGLVRGGRIDPPEGHRLVIGLSRAPLLRIGLERLLEQAWLLSDAVSAYDSLYVALARRESAPLITADARLARGAADLCDVRLLGPSKP